MSRAPAAAGRAATLRAHATCAGTLPTTAATRRACRRSAQCTVRSAAQRSAASQLCLLVSRATLCAAALYCRTRCCNERVQHKYGLQYPCWRYCAVAAVGRAAATLCADRGTLGALWHSRTSGRSPSLRRARAARRSARAAATRRTRCRTCCAESVSKTLSAVRTSLLERTVLIGRAALCCMLRAML